MTMNKLEVFFDYICPFCLKGHGYLKELHPRYPEIEIAWRPCEAHPRPESYGPHSDLCIRGMFLRLSMAPIFGSITKGCLRRLQRTDLISLT